MSLLDRHRRDGDAPTHASAARSHVGRVRTINEDRVLDRPERGLWAVADGMGGHSAGDIAAETVIAALDTAADGADRLDAARIGRALGAANADILGAARTDASGTTVVALLAAGHAATLFWAGDSRAYLLRAGTATCLTRDHSVVQELVDAGLLDDRRAASHPQANVITRALGIRPAPDIETRRLAVQPGDRILLCSDGLHRSLDARDLAGDQPVATLADRLLTNALQRDGTDNVSLVLVEIG